MLGHFPAVSYLVVGVDGRVKDLWLVDLLLATLGLLYSDKLPNLRLIDHLVRRALLDLLYAGGMRGDHVLAGVPLVQVPIARTDGVVLGAISAAWQAT